MRSLAAFAAVGGLFVATLYGGGKVLGVWDGRLTRATAASQASADAVPEGWKVHTVSGFSIGLPKSWKALGRKQNWDTRAFRRATPRLAKFLHVAAKGRSPHAKLAAFDFGRTSKQIARREFFLTNMTVIEVPVSLTPETVWKRERRALQRTPGRVGPVQAWRTRLDGRPAMAFRMRLRLRSPFGGQQVLSSLEWIVVDGGYGYALAYATTEAAEAKFAATFTRSAQTFRIVNASRAVPPTVKSFATQANAICASHQLPSVNVSAAKRMRLFAAVLTAQLRDLERLSAPPARAAQYREMLDAAWRLNRAIRKAANALARNDRLQLAEAMKTAKREANVASRLARDLGLTVCADS